MRWAIIDPARIACLGLASGIHVPLFAVGQVLGVIQLLDVAGRYMPSSTNTVRFADALLMPSTAWYSSDW
jgi:hypothetical protein